MTAQILRMNTAKAVTRINNAEVTVTTGRLVTDQDLERVISSRLFREWGRDLDPSIEIADIEIQFVLYRGEPSPERILFIVMNPLVSGSYRYAVVLRGATVVILPILLCEGVEYTLVTRQRRPAVGDRFFTEIPAGMTDGDNIIAKALTEFTEETGITIRRSDLHQMGGSAVEPTPGLVSEPMHFFYTRIEITSAQLSAFEGAMTGNRNEHEEIVLGVIPLEQLRVTAPRDAKAQLAYFFYRELYPKARKKWLGIF